MFITEYQVKSEQTFFLLPRFTIIYVFLYGLAFLKRFGRVTFQTVLQCDAIKWEQLENWTLFEGLLLLN